MKKYIGCVGGLIIAAMMTACANGNGAQNVAGDIDNNVDVEMKGEAGFDSQNNQQNSIEDIGTSEDAESTEGNAAIANPWTESDEGGVLAETGFDLQAPQNATDVKYSFMESSRLAQMTYQLDGASWVYRVQSASSLEDISGMNYEWTAAIDGSVSGRDAVYMSYVEQAENSEYIDGMNAVQVVNWYDEVTGTVYSLSASGPDLNGMDIQVYAEEVYDPLQGEVTDNPEKDREEELKVYFLGEHVRSEDESSVSIKEKSDGTFGVDIRIIKLCLLEDGVGTFDEHVMSFVVKDPSGNDMAGRIYRDSDNSLVVEITDSTWEYLLTGERLTGFGK